MFIASLFLFKTKKTSFYGFYLFSVFFYLNTTTLVEVYINMLTW